MQLVQLASGEHLWAERYDVPEEDFFAVQDEIAAKVANALTSRIDQTVLLAARRRKITSLAAYECWLRGMECLQRGTIESESLTIPTAPFTERTGTVLREALSELAWSTGRLG